MAIDATTLTAMDAAEALRSLEGFEQGLDRRTGGMTNMVWGLASAGIFLTYGSADTWIQDIGQYWLFGFLWIPWVAAGMALTAALWGSKAVTMGREPGTRSEWLASLGFTGAFLLILAAVAGIGSRVLGLDWDTNTTLVLVNGLFIGLIGSVHRRHDRACATYTLAAAVAVVLGALALAVVGIGDAPANLAGAAIVGAAWFVSGALTYRKG